MAGVPGRGDQDSSSEDEDESEPETKEKSDDEETEPWDWGRCTVHLTREDLPKMRKTTPHVVIS